MPCEGGPAHRAEGGFAGMARCRMGGGDENDVGPGAACRDELGAIVNRGGGEVAAIGGAGARAAAQVQTGPAGGGESPVARDHQRQPAGAADPRDPAGEAVAGGKSVMPEDDPGDVARQAGDEAGEVGVVRGIGEQEQRGEGCAAAALDRAGLADQLLVHDR